jgi:hypothetical protein
VEAVMVILHALFDLKPGVPEADFKKALGDFCGHLQTEGYVISWRWMRQIVPKGPAFPRPAQTHFVASSSWMRRLTSAATSTWQKTKSRFARSIER